MSDDPRLWIISPDGEVETFFPCALGAEPPVPPGYVLSRVAPAPKSAPAIRVITLVAFINRATDAEKAAVASNPLLLMALIEKVAEGGVPVVNLDSPRVVGMLIAAGVSPARIAELTADGNATEAG